MEMDTAATFVSAWRPDQTEENKRLLLVHRGTSSIPLEKILDVELDLDQNLISIVKDGTHDADVLPVAAAIACAADAKTWILSGPSTIDIEDGVELSA